MNPGPLFIIRNTFYLLLLAFTFSALIKFENTKKFYFLQLQPKTQKELYFIVLDYFLVLFTFLLVYLLVYLLLFTLLIPKPCA